jgi:hypothetical protein
MRFTGVDRPDEVKKAFPGFPRLVYHPTATHCKEPLVIVRARKGGLILCNCLSCPKVVGLSEKAFFGNLSMKVRCPKCHRLMKREYHRKNYVFVCEKCECGVRLADLLLHYSEVPSYRDRMGTLFE